MVNALNQLISQYPVLFKAAKLQLAINAHNDAMQIIAGKWMAFGGLALLAASILTAILANEKWYVDWLVTVSVCVAIASGIACALGFVLWPTSAYDLYQIHVNPTLQIYNMLIPQVGN